MIYLQTSAVGKKVPIVHMDPYRKLLGIGKVSYTEFLLGKMSIIIDICIY
jgi:hypothetical protein